VLGRMLRESALAEGGALGEAGAKRAMMQRLRLAAQALDDRNADGGQLRVAAQ